MRCPLCHQPGASLYHRDLRDYYQCERCKLVFVPPHQLPAAEAELTHYQLHQNSPEDLGYRRFLSRLVEPMLARLPGPARGLDFGCGTNPALGAMFHERGHRVAAYDPFFFPDGSLLTRRYDFVCCTEVIEHVHDPNKVWALLVECVLPGGMLGVMTKRVTSQTAFGTWHYKRDPTHVRFYSDATLAYVAKRFECGVELLDADVAIFSVPG